MQLVALSLRLLRLTPCEALWLFLRQLTPCEALWLTPCEALWLLRSLRLVLLVPCGRAVGCSRRWRDWSASSPPGARHLLLPGERALRLAMTPERS